MNGCLRRVAVCLVLSLPAAQVPAAMHDFDGDGRDDVFWRNTRTGANAVWPRGDSVAQAAMAGVANARWTVAGMGDFDGDGHADLFWRNRATGANTIWRSGNPATQQAVATVADFDWQAIGVGDFDGDAHADLLWHNVRTGANVYWRSANATARHGVGAVSAAIVLAGIGDFDGDGRDDVVWRNVHTGANALWPSGDASRAQVLAPIADPYNQVAAVGDFDGDGHADLLWRIPWGASTVVWRSGQSARWMKLPDVSGDWQIADVGDFDGDGRDDLFWRNFQDGRNAIWLSAKATTGLRRAAAPNPDWSIEPFEAQATAPVMTYDAPGTIPEGNAGTRPLTFRVRLSHPSAFPQHFDVFADAGPDLLLATKGVDYIAPSNDALTIAPGETTLDVTLSIVGDTTPEANEAIPISPYAIDDAVFLPRDNDALTIGNDDANTLWITGSRVAEGNSGLRPMTFTLHLSRPQATFASCTVLTTDPRTAQPPFWSAASAGNDYVAKVERVSIPPGEVEAAFTVQIIGDAQRESAWGEWFGVQLQNASGAVIVGDYAVGTIGEDDGPPIP